MTRLENIRYSRNNNRYCCVGERNSNAKLNNDDVIAIRRMHSDGITINDIALQYERGWSTINNVVKGNTWSHLL